MLHKIYQHSRMRQLAITLYDEDGNQLDLAALGRTPRMELRRSPESDPVAEFVVVVSGGTGRFTVDLGAVAARAIPPGPYFSRVLLQDNADEDDDIVGTKRYEFDVAGSETQR